MLCDNDANGEHYRGLDSGRDTEEEVETAIRLFPDVLSRRKEIVCEDDGDEFVGNFYPIQLLAFVRYEDGTSLHYWPNVKAVSFIPLLARVAIELGLLFDGKEERGGLLWHEEDGINNVLNYLMFTDHAEPHNREHHEHIDDVYLQVLIKLRKMDLLKKEDILMYNLLCTLCCNNDYFAEKRFRFLVEWDPSALIQPNIRYKNVPLHYAASDSTIQGFRIVFEYGIRYYPEKNGINLLLFHISNCLNEKTPFQHVCLTYGHGHEQVLEGVEDVLARYSDIPINIADALLSAAIDEDIHLDCVYFLLRREPDVLMKLLSNSSPLAIAAVSNSNSNNNNDNDNDTSEQTQQ
jgi:hypothetical protein